MYELSNQLLDRKIGRRSIVNRLVQAGVSLAGAGAIANNLVASEHSAASPGAGPLQTGAIQDGRPYLADVQIERYFDGRTSDSHTTCIPSQRKLVRPDR